MKVIHEKILLENHVHLHVLMCCNSVAKMNAIRDIWPCVASGPPAPAEFARKAFGMKLLSPKQPAAINVYNLVVLNVHSL